MKKIDSQYCFSVNDQINYPFSIFNNDKFIALHSNNFKKVYKYLLIENKNKVCVGYIIFAVNKSNKVISPINGSFGGFQFKEKLKHGNLLSV